VHAIERFAGEDLKQHVVPAVCRGELLIAVSMSEPQAGTALTDLKTRGTVKGESVVLNGTKRWCSGGASISEVSSPTRVPRTGVHGRVVRKLASLKSGRDGELIVSGGPTTRPLLHDSGARRSS
jgi:alkylation response protein AidB-like acyl-CoA dehydrogenase